MSKSMNKYHKRSESGMLPGWVKLGAVAVGVGVGGGMDGVPVPGNTQGRENIKCRLRVKSQSKVDRLVGLISK